MLTKALCTVLRTDLEITGAGRTDTGVHARLMVAHFDLETDLPGEFDLTNKLNSILPNDIVVFKVVEVRPEAHARFDAISRKYEYHVITAKNAFKNELAARVGNNMDFEAMNRAASVLKDYRDFTSFSKLHTDVKTNNCSITHAEWTQQGDEWVFTIQADRFLRNMVRAIVGTLFEVGRGRISVEDFKAIIEAKDRCKAGTSVPAHGLYLVDIQYSSDLFL